MIPKSQKNHMLFQLYWKYTRECLKNDADFYVPRLHLTCYTQYHRNWKNCKWRLDGYYLVISNLRHISVGTHQTRMLLGEAGCYSERFSCPVAEAPTKFPRDINDLAGSRFCKMSWTVLLNIETASNYYAGSLRSPLRYKESCNSRLV